MDDETQASEYPTGRSDSPTENGDGHLDRLGDYRVPIREIGRGGMGVVYEAEQESLARRVALKVLPDLHGSSADLVRRFQREARTAASLHHTNIVPVFGVGESNGTHFFAMQYIDGQGLDVFLAKHRCGSTSGAQGNTEGQDRHPEQGTADVDRFSETLPFGLPTGDAQGTAGKSDEPVAGSSTHHPEMESESVTDEGSSEERLVSSEPASVKTMAISSSPGAHYWRQCARIGGQAAEALHHAHEQGILHRDVKPANILLDKKGTVWITDFGLARFVERPDLTKADKIVGTLRYMAPESLDGKTDARSDIFGLGLTLYELLTLRPAIQESDVQQLIRQKAIAQPPRPRTIVPGIPRDLETIVLKATAPEPEHRYQTARELADDLTRFLEDLPILARRTSAVQRVWRWSRRNPVAATLMLLVFVLTACIAVVASVGYVHTKGEFERANDNLQLAMDAFADVFDGLASTTPQQPLDLESETTGSLQASFSVVTEEEAVVLQGLLKFYHQFAERNENRPGLHQQTADAHRRVGEIDWRLGRMEEAATAYDCALEIYRDLCGRFPDEVKYRILSAAVLNDRGRIAADSGQVERARNNHLEALSLLRVLVASTDSAPEVRYELARTCNLLGALALRPGPMAGRRAAGLEGFEEASEILEILMQAEPENLNYQRAAAQSYVNRMLFAGRQGQLAEAEEWRNKATQMLEELLTRSPGDAECTFELAETYAIMSYGEHRSVTSKAALERLQRAEQLGESLLVHRPNVPVYIASLARTRLKCGELLSSLGQTTEAEIKFAQAISSLEILAEKYTKVPSYAINLAQVRLRLGELRHRNSRFPDSRATLEKGVSEFETFLDTQSGQPMGLRLLAKMHRALADSLRSLGEVSLAAEVEKRADAAEAQRRTEFRQWQGGGRGRGKSF